MSMLRSCRLIGVVIFVVAAVMNSPYIKRTLCRDYSCDSTTIRLRRIARACFQVDAIRREQKNEHVSVFRRSRVVVVW